MKGSDQLRKMAKHVPEGRYDDLKNGLDAILERYRHKARHTRDKKAIAFYRDAIKATIVAAEQFIKFSELLEEIGDRSGEFETVHANVRLSRKLTALEIPAVSGRLRFAAELAVSSAAALQKTMSVVTSPTKKKQKLPQVAPALELIGLWERLTGKQITSPKVGKGLKGRGTNASPDAEFVYQGLSLLDPSLDEKNCRTLIKNAIACRKEAASVAAEIFRGVRKRRGKMPSRLEALAEVLSYVRQKKYVRK